MKLSNKILSALALTTTINIYCAYKAITTYDEARKYENSQEVIMKQHYEDLLKNDKNWTVGSALCGMVGGGLCLLGLGIREEEEAKERIKFNLNQSLIQALL